MSGAATDRQPVFNSDGRANAGAGLDDVVRTRLLLVNIDERGAGAAAGRSVCGSTQDALPIVEVSRVVEPEWRVERKVDAVTGWTP